MSNGISFSCDSCGREVFGCNIVNGMKFCAKCYQETFGNEQKYVDMLNKESSKLLVNSLTEKDKKIAELQKQLEASETQNKRVLEKLELITKSNQELEENNRIGKEAYKYLRKEYDKRIEENKQAHILNDGAYERIKNLEQQLYSQPAEIIDEIKKQMDARKLEYISHLTKKHCYGLRINRIFEILDEILKEYQKGEN